MTDLLYAHDDVVNDEREGEKQEKQKAEHCLFPCANGGAFSFLGFFGAMIGSLDVVGEYAAAFNDSCIIIFHNRTSEFV